MHAWLLDDFGVRYAEELAKVPGAERLRQRTLENALSYYHKFIDLAGNDPTFHRDRAVTYTKIGTITQLLGEHAKVLEAYEKAGEIFRQLAESHPGADRPWADLAVCYNNIGLLESRAGRTDEAKNAYQEAIRIQERLVQERPDDAQYAGTSWPCRTATAACSTFRRAGPAWPTSITRKR